MKNKGQTRSGPAPASKGRIERYVCFVDSKCTEYRNVDGTVSVEFHPRRAKSPDMRRWRD